jgi:hypothetical protein
MFGRKDAAAIAWKRNKRGPIGSLDAAGSGDQASAENVAGINLKT